MSRDPKIGSDLKALMAWIRLLRRIRPDVLEVGTPKAGLLGLLAGRLTRVPRRIYILRGLRLESENGVKRMILHALERVAASCSTDVLAVSASLRERALELCLCGPDRIQVLGAGSSNGVDTSEGLLSFAKRSQARADIGIRSSDIVVGFVGRQTADKGMLELGQASDALARDGVEHVLLILGAEESSNPIRFQPLVGRKVIRLGQVDKPEEYFPLMDVLCLPTHREGFPNVVLEAAVAEVPTVTTTATGARDAVIDGITGYTVGVHDVTSLTERLRRLLEDSEMRQKFGIAARVRAETHFERTQIQSLHADFLLRAPDGDRGKVENRPEQSNGGES